jgi:hypothetical protein
MRILSAMLITVSCGAGSAAAQQPSAAAAPTDSSDSADNLSRIRTALEAPPPLVIDGTTLFTTDEPKTYHLGMLTFLTPEARGEAVSVGVPIGELVMKVPHAVSAARRRHAEKAAKEEVARALDDFFRAQQK